MKSFTDVEQSKKLAKILPMESADMWWAERYAGRIEGYEYIVEGEPIYYMSFTKPSEGNWSQDKIKDIPCWSLAALFNILPIGIETHNQTDGYKVYYYIELYMKRMGKDIYLSTERHESLVDACCEMIVELNKRGLL